MDQTLAAFDNVCVAVVDGADEHVLVCPSCVERIRTEIFKHGDITPLLLSNLRTSHKSVSVTMLQVRRDI